MGPYAGLAVVDYNLTLGRLQGRLRHIYQGHWATHPIPESTLTLCQNQLYPLVRDLGFGHCCAQRKLPPL